MSRLLLLLVGPNDFAALVAGERDADVLAELSKGRIRKKIPELRQALRAGSATITPC